MKKLRVFNTKVELNSATLENVNVCLVRDENKVYYNYESGMNPETKYMFSELEGGEKVYFNSFSGRAVKTTAVSDNTKFALIPVILGQTLKVYAGVSGFTDGGYYQVAKVVFLKNKEDTSSDNFVNYTHISPYESTHVAPITGFAFITYEAKVISATEGYVIIHRY